jgi:hypothetical protein
MKIYDLVLCGLAFVSLGYFSGAIITLIVVHRRFWLTPKEKEEE